jgi:hypothetical protein
MGRLGCEETDNLPIALRNPPLNTSVFFTSPLNTSDPTIGQKGTFDPSSCDNANARAVYGGRIGIS